MVYNMSSSIQVQPISTIPIWGVLLEQVKLLRIGIAVFVERIRCGEKNTNLSEIHECEQS